MSLVTVVAYTHVDLNIAVDPATIMEHVFVIDLATAVSVTGVDSATTVDLITALDPAIVCS